MPALDEQLDELFSSPWLSFISYLKKVIRLHSCIFPLSNLMAISLFTNFPWVLFLKYMWCVARFGTICTILTNVKNTHEGVAGYSNFTKVTLLHGCFSRLLNCTNDTKLRKASHIMLEISSQIVTIVLAL